MKDETQLKAKLKPRNPKRKSSAGRQTVHLEMNDLEARSVCVAGTFNDWKAEECEMVRFAQGRWAADLTLKPGTYEYRLVVDGKWIPDPQADHTALNPFGERNSLLTVP